MKKLIIIIAVIICIVALVVGANIAAKNINVKNVVTTIIYQSSDQMLTKEDINNALFSNFGEFVGKKRKEVNTKSIMQYLNSCNFVANCQVYLGILGRLEINVIQSKPIAIILDANKRLYLTNEATLMQPIEKRTANVITINGNSNLKIAKSAKDTTKNKLLSDSYNLTQKIYDNALLKEKLASIVVNKNKTFTLLPSKANYMITFGSISNLDTKLKHLEYLYRNTNITDEQWSSYSEINLTFNNQAICMKRK